VKSILKNVIFNLEFALIGTVTFFLRKNDKSKKQLVIVQLDAIGDYIIFTDILKRFRKYYSFTEWNIILVGEASWENLIEIKVGNKDSWVDKFISIASNDLRIGNYLNRLRHLLYLKKIDADLLLNPNLARTENMDLVVRYIGAKEKIGFERGYRINGSSKYKNRNNHYYTKLFPKVSENKHELTAYRVFINNLGGKLATSFEPKLIYTAQDSEIVKDLIGNTEEYFVFSPYAGHPLKSWPSKKFQKIAKWLLKEYEGQVFFTGSSDQAGLIEEVFVAGLKLSPKNNLAGKLSLRQMVYLIKNSKIVISNDSMAAHMAIAMKAKLICLLAGIVPLGKFFPYPNQDPNFTRVVYNRHLDCFGCYHKCIFDVSFGQPGPCVADLSTKVVKSHIIDLLEI